jgi:hypothetical protein
VLEVFLSADRRTVGFWALTEAGEALTDQEMEGVISALRAAGAASNAEFIPILWQIV